MSPDPSGGPLAGIEVLDLSRNAPGPYASLLLAQLGASVTTVTGGRTGPALDELSHGKRHVTLNLRAPAGREAALRLAEGSDVFLESFRPGVCDRLGVGYEAVSARNPGIVYCSLTGYGQTGDLAHRAGHDINYLAVAGLLACLGPADGMPAPPLNLVGDLGGGGLWAAFGVVSALVERGRTGRGRYVDTAMVDGVLSMMLSWFAMWRSPVLPDRGRGLVTGEAPFYRCYPCADGRLVAVGAIEPRFFAALWDLLGLDGPVPDHLASAGWAELADRLAERFLRRTRDEWVAAAAGVDACISPVLSPDEVVTDPAFGDGFHGSLAGVPTYVPRPDWLRHRDVALGVEDDTAGVLRARGLSDAEVAAVVDENEAAGEPELAWPPPLG
jgi:alpha-methylacyl-CoA racemase